MAQAVVQLHIIQANLDVKVFLMQLCLLMFPTKLYCCYVLTYVLNLCQLFYHGPLSGPSSEAF